MTEPGVTAYDEAALPPGPTVDTVLAGTAGGWLAAWLLLDGLTTDASPARLGVAAGVVLLAGGWSGWATPTRWLTQGLYAGLLTGVWIAAAVTLPAGVLAALVPIQAAVDAEPRGQEVVDLVLPWASAAGVAGALRACVLAVTGALGTAAVGAALGRLVPSKRPPHPMDTWLLDYAHRLALGLVALGALLHAYGVVGLSPVVGPSPTGSQLSPERVAVLWELALHTGAAAVVVVVVRALWRLPRTAPETRVRVVVDGTLLALVLAAVAWARVVLGGPWFTWLIPLLPWGVALLTLAATGRPRPPPRPPRGAVSPWQALAFASLGVAVPVAMTTLLLWPALVTALAVSPWIAYLVDPSAQAPAAADMLGEARGVLVDSLPAVLALVAVLGAATWVVRAVAARWLRDPSPERS